MKESRLIFKELPDLSNSEMGRLLRDSNSNPETRISSNASENLPDDFNDSLLTEISIVAEKISTFVSDLLSHPEFFENEAAQG